jgi:electron transport complex protein RnfD
MEQQLRLSSSPHFSSDESVKVIMRDVILALLPATAAGVFFFGMSALMTVVLSVVAAIGTEYFIQRFMRKTPSTIGDLSAVVTGLLLALNLPSSVPWFIPVLGSVFAIAIVKQAFGGLGFNFMNPALGARAFLMASWPTDMTTWLVPGTADAVTGPTALGIIKEGLNVPLPPMMDALIGNVGGCIGETSALLIILGGLYLVWRGVINIRIPLMYIGTTFVLLFLLNGFDFTISLYHIFIGGLMLGAFFMATDYSSTPVNLRGQLIFAFGAGLLTALIRQFGGYPEGVSYSILLMNVASPLIEKYSKSRVFGGGKK